MISDASRVVKNSIWVFSAMISAKAANVIGFILISRFGGVDKAGIFSLVTIYLLILSSVIIGLDELVTRQIARDVTQAKPYFSAYLFLRIVIGGVFYLLFVLVSHVLNYPALTVRAVLWFGLCLIPDGVMLVSQAVLSAFEQYRLAFFSGLITGAVRIFGIYGLVMAGYGIVEIGQVWLLGSVLGALIVFPAAIHRAGGLVLTPDWRAVIRWQEMRLNIPFFLISLLLTLQYQIDVIILSKLQGDVFLGLYSAVTTVFFSAQLIPQAYRAAVYPLMVRLYTENAQLMVKVYRISTVSLGILVFPMVVGLVLLGPQVLEWIYSPLFAPAGSALQIIVIALVFLFLNIPNSRVVLIYEKQNMVPALILFCLTLNIVLNLILIPDYNIQGAAIARVITEGVFYCVMLLIAIRLVGYHQFLEDLLLPLLASGLMGLVVWPLHAQALWLPILAGVVSYALILAILVQFSKGYKEIVVEIVRALWGVVKGMMNHSSGLA